jgi:hypothetical protein
VERGRHEVTGVRRRKEIKICYVYSFSPVREVWPKVRVRFKGLKKQPLPLCPLLPQREGNIRK